jgi:two-component system CheB/CheR fusion protein
VDEDRLLGLIEQEAVARAVKQSSDELSALREFHRDALDSLPLPVIATDLDGAVTLWNGAAARLWRRPAEEVIHRRLTALGLPGLRAELLLDESAAVRAGKAPARVAESELSVPGADPRLLRIEVTPLVSAANELIGLLYVVHDATSVRSLDEELRTARAERGRAVEDLQTANEELQSSNEELETTNEELQSANEELQTTNEELQSINEELETTNEELHSANAELDATNRELAHRTEELNLLGFYQRTIIRSLSSAVAVLDPQGRITLWNLAAERLFGITEPEALGQLFWTLRLPIVHRGLVARIRRSLTKQVALRVDELSYERPGGAQAHAALAAVPLVEAGRYLGAVILVEDTTRAVLLAEERIASARRRDQRRAGAPREAPRRGGKLVKLQIPREPK